MQLSHLQRIAIARVITTLICSTAVTVLWVDDGGLAGSFTFLALTYRELAFPSGATLGQHVESTVVNTLAIWLSIAWCQVGKQLAALAVRRHGNVPIIRAIPAIFLVTLAFTGGLIKSLSPRLTVPSRMAGITAVFLLTNKIGVSHVDRHSWSDFMIIAAIAASSSLIATILFLRNSSKSYPHVVVSSLAELRRHIAQSVEATFRPPNMEDKSLPTPPVAPKFAISTGDLHQTYARSCLESHYTRLHVEDIRGFTHIIDRLRTELSWGSMVPDHLRSSRSYVLYAAVEAPCKTISESLCRSIQLLEDTINYGFDLPGASSSSSVRPADLVAAYQKTHEDAASAVKLLKIQLSATHASLDRRRRSSPLAFREDPEDDEFSKEVFAISLYTVSLLQLAADLNTALRVGKKLTIRLMNRDRRRLWLPKLSKAWFTSHTSNLPYDVNDFNVERFAQELSNEPSPSEQREGIVEEEEEVGLLPQPVTATASSRTTTTSIRVREPTKQLARKNTGMSLNDVEWSLKRLWASWIVPRRKWSKTLHRVKHSKHLQYALKNAFGVAAVSLAAFLPAERGGDWFQHAHGQWAVATYIYVLEANTGSTIRTGGLRLAGTISGAIYAYVAWEIAHQNPYAVTILVTLAEFPITWLILCTSVSPIGVIASITIPPVTYTNLHRHADMPTYMIAVTRGAAVGAGVIVAVLMNHFVYPRHCRRIFLDQVAQTLGRFNELYLSLSRSLSRHTSPSTNKFTPDPFVRKNIKLENEIRESIFRMNALIDMMHLEFSILPKPLKTYRHLTRTLQRGVDLMIGIRRVRDHIPKKETITDVMSFRHEVISCICISLFACEATFRTGAALPQFLPSPQAAIDALFKQKEQHSLHLRTTSSDGESTRVLSNEVLFSFALAENWLLQEFVATLEEILGIGRRLHGVEEWLDEEPGSPEAENLNFHLNMNSPVTASTSVAQTPALTSAAGSRVDFEISASGSLRSPHSSGFSTPTVTPPLSRPGSVHRWI